MIGLANNVCSAEWNIKGLDLAHPQTITLLVYGTTKPWRGECVSVLLARTEVMTCRTEDANGIEWHSLEGISVHLKIKRKVMNIRIAVSVPEEIIAVLRLYNREKTEIELPMSHIKGELFAGDMVAIHFPRMLVKFGTP
jgi:hypothetical protein